MTQFTPNKEIVRRICSIFKCNRCWLLNESDSTLSVLVQLDTDLVDKYKEELESWSGCPFNVYNFESPKAQIKKIQQLGEPLLPIEKNTPMEDIEMRRRYHHKNK